jgi:ABC-type Zn uptake system ZnuABC Zn-binding protein ZnuA
MIKLIGDRPRFFWKKTVVCPLFFLLIACNFLPTESSLAQQTDSGLILTSIAPIYKITQSLVVGTNIKVENIPERPRSMAAQPTFFARQGERYTEQFNSADAVVTIGKIWPEDSFYTTAREANIRVVNIDASKPWSHEISGVAVSSSPVSGTVSPYFWTSPSNTIRMLNIVGRDLQTLYPDQAATISSNLEREKNFYLNLKADFESQFIEVFDPVVYALADEFTYLTSDLGIFVDNYFVKQDIDWTEDDLAKLTTTLTSSNIKVVLHKWEPSEEIQAAISAADARLLILDLMETSTETYQASMENNLSHILEALSP